MNFKKTYHTFIGVLFILCFMIMEQKLSDAFRSKSFQIKSKLRNVISMMLTGTAGATVGDLSNMNVKEVLRAVAGDQISVKDTIANCDVVKTSPTICKFIIANPKAFFESKDIAKYHGFETDKFNASTPLASLTKHLPVLYIAGFSTVPLTVY